MLHLMGRRRDGHLSRKPDVLPPNGVCTSRAPCRQRSRATFAEGEDWFYAELRGDPWPSLQYPLRLSALRLGSLFSSFLTH